MLNKQQNDAIELVQELINTGLTPQNACNAMLDSNSLQYIVKLINNGQMTDVLDYFNYGLD